jgi:hypothetical protein
MAGEIADLAAELARTAGGKQPFSAEAIASARNDGAFDNKPDDCIPKTRLGPLAKRSANWI